MENINFNPIILISGNFNCLKEKEYMACGVYMCSGLNSSENFKHPIYIGSSNNINERIKYDHIPNLNKQNHGNPIFQKSWNKNGANSFVWFALEICPIEDQFKVEQKWLDFYRPFVDEKGGYNIVKEASGGRAGITHSPESIEKMKKVQRKRFDENPGTFLGRKHTEKTKILMGAKSKGRRLSEASRKKISDKKSKSFKLKSPNGEIVEGVNLFKFCKENQLDYRTIGRVIKGTHINHKGWTSADFNLKRKITCKTFKFISPENKVILIENISKFCRDNNIGELQMRDVARGRRLNFNGWRKYV